LLGVALLMSCSPAREETQDKVDNPATPQESKSSQSLEYVSALQRGTQAVIWGLPAVSMKGFCGSMQTDLGAGKQAEPKSLSRKDETIRVKAHNPTIQVVPTANLT
jgi:hypothetical protein